MQTSNFKLRDLSMQKLIQLYARKYYFKKKNDKCKSVPFLKSEKSKRLPLFFLPSNRLPPPLLRRSNSGPVPMDFRDGPHVDRQLNSELDLSTHSK